MLLIYFVILLFSIPIKITLAKSSPVLIYGYKGPKRPVFPMINTDEFQQIVEGFIQNFIAFVLLEDDLQARDLSCKSMKKEECFGDFPANVENSTFYPNVDNPILALQNIRETVQIFLDDHGHLALSEQCESIDDNKMNTAILNKTRVRQRQKKDFRVDMMNSITNFLAKCKDKRPLFIFTASLSTGVDLEDGENKNALLVKGFSTTIVNGVVIIDVATKAHKMFEKTDAEIKNLTLKIVKKPGYYTTVSATYDGEEYQSKPLKWPKEFTPNTPGLVFTHGNKKLRINKIQLERFSVMEKTIKEANRTGDDWHTCVYVTPGILMGLFVTFILCSIMYCGLSMIVDIKTNDRFDGPKMQALQLATSDN